MATKTKQRKTESKPEATAPEGIQSIEQLDQALRELGELQGRERQLQVDCDREVAAIKARYQGLMTCAVNGCQQPIPERRAALEKQIEEYCSAHRSEILEGKAKSVELTHGKISWRKSPSTVAELEGGTWSKHIAAVMEAVTTAMKRVKVISSVAAASIMRVKIDVDKKAALQLYTTAQLSTAQLRRLGLAVQEGDEKISIEPAAVNVENHAAS